MFAKKHLSRGNDLISNNFTASRIFLYRFEGKEKKRRKKEENNSKTKEPKKRNFSAEDARNVSVQNHRDEKVKIYSTNSSA